MSILSEKKWGKLKTRLEVDLFREDISQSFRKKLIIYSIQGGSAPCVLCAPSPIQTPQIREIR